jgi:hypothetical protein
MNPTVQNTKRFAPVQPLSILLAFILFEVSSIALALTKVVTSAPIWSTHVFPNAFFSVFHPLSLSTFKIFKLALTSFFHVFTYSPFLIISRLNRRRVNSTRERLSLITEE